MVVEYHRTERPPLPSRRSRKSKVDHAEKSTRRALKRAGAEQALIVGDQGTESPRRRRNWGSLILLLIGLGLMAFALWQLGPFAERFWGPRRMLVGFLLTGIAGSAASCVWNVYIWPAKEMVDSLGASGAVCGLLGMLLGMTFRPRVHLPPEAVGQLKQWAVFIIVFGLLVPGIDNAAHIGGMLAGLAFGYVVPPVAWGEPRDWRGRAWTAGAP